MSTANGAAASSSFNRVLLKLSGEVFGGGAVGLDLDVVSDIARQIRDGSRHSQNTVVGAR